MQGIDHVYVSGITMKNPANHTLIFQKCNDAVVEEAKHHDIVFKNIMIDHGQPWTITNAENLGFDNVQQSHISINEF